MNEAILLAFNLDGASGAKLEAICRSMNISPRFISNDSRALPLGTLLGLPVSPAPNDSRGTGFEEPMLVMCRFEEEQFNAFLQALRYSGLPRIDLKAVLTPTNIMWTPAQLRDELHREHAEMQSLRQKKTPT